MTEKTKAQIDAEIQTSFPTTGAGAITAATTRSFLQDFSDSTLNLISADNSANININPALAAVDISYANTPTLDRFTYGHAHDLLQGVKRLTGSADALGGEGDSNFRLFTRYDATTTGSQYQVRTIGLMNRVQIGQTAASQGSILGESINIQLYDYNSSGSGGGISEIGNTLNVINCIAANTNHDANYWLTDWSIHGPNSGQERFMGCVLSAQKYNSTETIDSDHLGFYGWSVQSRPGSGGGGESKAGLTSYRGRAAFSVSGYAGPVGTATDGLHAAATDAWEYCFAAGLTGAIWLGATARSRVTTGFYAKDFTGYGLEIDTRNTTAATGNAIYVHSGAGTVGILEPPDGATALLCTTLSGQRTVATFIDRTDDANPSPRFALQRGRATTTAGDLVGALDWKAKNSSGSQATYASLVGRLDTITAGAEAGSLILQVMNGGTLNTAATFNASNLNLTTGTVFAINATQVVGPRSTGWTAMTGTPDKASTFDTSSVTLAQLAGRVMSLQAALTTHGLIGA